MASGLLILLPGLEIPTKLILPAIIVNVWQVATAPSFPVLLRRFGTLGAGILVGSAAVRLLGIHGNGVCQAAFGLVILAASAAAMLSGERKLPPQWERRFSPIIGLSSGLVGGVAGIAFPALLYLTMLELDPNERIAASGSFFVALLPALMTCSGNSNTDIGISLSSAWKNCAGHFGIFVRSDNISRNGWSVI